MATTHSRNASAETNATADSYSMILEHVLQYPGSYEIPLRVMYTLNCAPRAQPLPASMSRAPSPHSGAHSPTPSFAWNDAESSSMNFTSQLMNHMSRQSSERSLPPGFIISFVSRCFHPCLALVDFPQALTAMDYLRDLERKRCMEYVKVLHKLGISIETFAADVAKVAELYPGIALWANNMKEKNKKAEQFYSIMYLRLRRWIMINEMSLEPFNKLNCMGMLNTLLPPQAPSGSSKLPTPLLTPQLLRDERQSFFEYIGLVEKQGARCLKPIIELDRAPGDATGWDSLQKIVDKYLRVTKNMIEDCTNTSTADFTAVDDARKGKKTDSGVSFGSDQRPSTGHSSIEKPLPPPPEYNQQVTKGLSPIERITREFKRMRKPRLDVEEIVKIDKQPAPNNLAAPIDAESRTKRSLKKARSFANLGHLRGSNGSSASLVSRKESNAAQFDPEEMKRARMVYEASTTAKGSRNLL